MDKRIPVKFWKLSGSGYENQGPDFQKNLRKNPKFNVCFS